MVQRIHEPRHLLRKERLQRHWSQQELAEQLNTSVVTINRWERGVTSPSAYYRVKLCAIFQKSAVELGLTNEAPDPTNTSVLYNNSPTSIFDQPSLPLSTNDSGQSPNHLYNQPIWYVPLRRNPFFTGQEQLLRHLNQVFQSSQPQVLALTGLGGIGKTQLALEYVYRYKASYQTILWLHAETNEVLQFDCQQICQQLRFTTADQLETQKLLTVWLRQQQSDQRWLLVLDNVEDVQLVEHFLPASFTGHVLLTTRRHTTGALAKHVNVAPLSHSESVQLLLYRSRYLPLQTQRSFSLVSREDSAASEIATLLAGHPLAIDQAGAYIEETGCGLADYLERYQCHQMALLARRGHAPLEHPASALTTIQLCLQQLDQRQPQAAAVLRFCSFLHSHTITEDILQKGITIASSTLAMAINTPLLLDEAIVELRLLSLVHRTMVTKYLVIHRLVQSMVRSTLSEYDQKEWINDVIATIDQLLPKPEQLEDIRWYEELMPQIVLCSSYITQWHISTSVAVQLLVKAGGYCVLRGHYSQAVQFLQQAYPIYQHLKSIPQWLPVMLLSRLGRAYEVLGNYKHAQEAYEQAILLNDRVQLENKEMMDLYESTVRLTARLGNYEQATNRLAPILNQIEQLKKVPAHCIALLHTAAALQYKQGHRQQAHRLFQKALLFSRQLADEIHPLTIECFSNLALFYYMEKEYKQVEVLFQHILDQLQNMCSNDIYQNVDSLRHLGNLYILLGQWQQAEALLKQALAISQRTFGKQHTETAECYRYLSFLYKEQKVYRQAQEMLHHTCTILIQLFGERHLEMVEIYKEQAVLSQLEGYHERAEILQQRAIEIERFFSDIFQS